ncbi:MAG: hypothetical protein EA415_05390 [Sphaerobacteraceae bacterium]|nr:MAG: hypothetical protein EA415_05390 [Sphaerobacteraceae bacterium]
MPTIHPRFWDIAYAAILILAVPVAVFHAVQDRWAQAILVTLAAAGGAFMLITGWNQTPAPSRARTNQDDRSDITETARLTKIELERYREPSGRVGGWLPMGAVSGFVATGIMTAVVLIGYGFAALLGSTASGANQFQVWMAGLVNNTVTEIATVNLAMAIGIHLVAGILWAIVYAAIFEPRLPGGGFQRGMIFAMVPFILSISIFFPLIGAGIFGMGIEAGPLPVLGNLILHLIYGAALGKVFASNAVWAEPVRDVSATNVNVLEVAHRGMAIGLLPGAILGLITSIVFTTVFTSETDLLMAGVLGAVVGSAVGVWIGSLAGLNPDLAENGTD